MSKSLSPEAIEALRRLNDVGVGQLAPPLSATITAEPATAGNICLAIAIKRRRAMIEGC